MTEEIMEEITEKITVFNQIKTLGLPVAYGVHTKWQDPPYLCIIGAGQEHWPADDTYYYKRDLTQLEYYFKKKNAEQEEAIEKLLLDNGYLYEKTEDIYLEDQDLFLIYYTF